MGVNTRERSGETDSTHNLGQQPKEKMFLAGMWYNSLGGKDLNTRHPRPHTVLLLSKA